MTAVLMTPPYVEFMDANGDPLAGGKVYAYEAGTLTPKNTFTDSTEATPNTNPVILDSAGRASIWINGSYDFVIKTSADATIRTAEDVTSFSTSATNLNSLLPPQTGNAGKFLTTDGVNSSWGTSSGVTLGTPVATTSGTAIDFTGLPAGVKQIIISLEGVDQSATGFYYLQIGDSGGIETTNYSTNYANFTNAAAVAVSGGATEPAFYIPQYSGGEPVSGTAILTLIDASTYTWACVSISKFATNQLSVTSSTKSLSATLDMVRFAVQSGAFTAGKINIQYQ